jgi:inosine-uridine nucleoside N-ribohydrolase
VSVGTRIPIILDVDTGLDDALALILAVRDPAVELVAVTTLAGNVNVWKSTANTLAVLDELGADHVPVHRGASRPLVEPPFDASNIHGVTGLGDAVLRPSTRAVGADRGPASIIRLAKSRPGELTLVCTGPLTNLAIALNVEPDLPGLLKRVVVMGGAYRVPGNTRPWAEFNILLDPDAAKQVFDAEWPDITAIGLDVTHQTIISRPQWERLQGGQTVEAALTAAITRYTFETRARDEFYLHDPLALGVGIDPTFVDTEVGKIDVVIDGPERGRTIFTAGEGTTRVAFGVAADRFFSIFGRALGVSLAL